MCFSKHSVTWPILIVVVLYMLLVRDTNSDYKDQHYFSSARSVGLYRDRHTVYFLN